MRARTPGRSRRGYAMALVSVFLVVIMAMLGATYRQIAAALRVGAARSAEVAGDDPRMQAAAWALGQIQTQGPPASGTSQVYPPPNVPAAQHFLVTFTTDPADPAAATGPVACTVDVVPYTLH